MSEYIYESDDEGRLVAQEIAALKEQQKAIEERMKILTQRLIDKHVEVVDFIDESTGKRWYMRMERSRTRTCDIEALTINYPQYLTHVTRLVDDRKKLNRLIEGGLIDENKVMTTRYGAKYPKVYEIKDSIDTRSEV